MKTTIVVYNAVTEMKNKKPDNSMKDMSNAYIHMNVICNTYTLHTKPLDSLLSFLLALYKSVWWNLDICFITKDSCSWVTVLKTLQD